MKRARLLFLAALSALVGNIGTAETRELLTTSGSWNLFRVDGYMLADGNKQHLEINGACVAETEYDGARLNFATLPPEANSGREQFSSIVILQVVSTNWSFPTREASLKLVSGHMSQTVAGLLYEDDMITFNLGGFGSPPVMLYLLAETATGFIEIRDDSEASIAKFPSEGLKVIYNEMLKCGGIER